MGNIQWFILIYFIGAYIKLYKKGINNKRGLIFLYPLISIILYASLGMIKYSKSLEIIKKNDINEFNIFFSGINNIIFYD